MPEQPGRERPASGAPLRDRLASLAGEYAAFVRVAAGRPRRVGAVLPTSAWGGRALAQVVPASRPATVVELGPGTGSVSDVVHQRLAPGSTHIAIELDADMVRHLREAKPWLDVVHGDAADLRALLAEHDVGELDAVVSALPWTLMTGEQQSRVLAEVARALRPGAPFTTIVYNHGISTLQGRLFRRRLERVFDEVLLTRTVWRNMPPARTYVCRTSPAR
ncbi:phospholipid N-methyltransferase [Murinocardiopsis flavida]|uniref:Phospholipid N-methyltransferase n=1 Tax=Murinocardiopsis flavida TaxID=645275 RepID=A0A2P8DE26_9ACTN|nr:methyltransferase domain-containing protein [Murinocardiopsis flavida]PSK95452.1 phospholipid N-methyltransferase [Murinocardiopsis flavida]